MKAARLTVSSSNSRRRTELAPAALTCAPTGNQAPCKTGSRAVVIVMTAYPDVSTATKTLKHGAIDYIQKPFTVDEVDKIIREVLATKTPASHEQIKSLKEGLSRHEKEIIEKALIKAKKNKAQAAKLLNVSERTLWYKVKKYGLDQ